jgi:hypothetical protein
LIPKLRPRRLASARRVGWRQPPYIVVCSGEMPYLDPSAASILFWQALRPAAEALHQIEAVMRVLSCK